MTTKTEILTKEEKRKHNQRLINMYNKQLEETERIFNQTDNPYIELKLLKRMSNIKNKLIKLYGTEAYRLV